MFTRRECGAFALGVLVTGGLLLVAVTQFEATGEAMSILYAGSQQGATLGAAADLFQAASENTRPPDTQPTESKPLQPRAVPSLVPSLDPLRTVSENKKPPETPPTESKPLQPRAVPSSILCRKNVAASSALALFCREAPGYPEIWADGMLMLGEKALVDYVQHWGQHPTKLGGKQLSVWYDRRDLKASAMLHEQAVDNYGLKKLLSDAGDKWILDFGGNAGFTAICEANLAPDAHVLTMEPSPWTYLILRANLAQAKLHSRVIALRGGMGGQTGSLQGVHYFTASSGVSLHAAGERSSHAGGAFTSPIFTLPELIKKYSIDHIALVKLDCEGCEFSSAHAWLQDGLSDRIPQMVGEFHHAAFKGGKSIQDWPKEWTLSDAKRFYKFMCGTPSVVMHKGCKHGRRDPLHENYDSSGER